MIESLYQHFKECSGVSTDTRNIQDGSIFFALKGPNFNANKLAEEALQKGAKYAVIDEPEFKKDDQYILVEDVLSALQKLANHHRKQYQIPFIGITGSNGKTTTKELMREVLAAKYKVHATVGNFNNHIGVPLTLLSMPVDTEIAIIEMGANRVGDIGELSAIAEPTHGVITNIGKAHVGNFGGFENIIRTKSELYHFLIRHKGQVWINSNEDILMNMSKRFENPLFYPNKNDYYHAEMVSASPFVKVRAENGEEFETQLVGGYNFGNIATALCIGKYFEVDSELANEAVSNYVPSNNRSQIIKRGTNTIVMDAYNANPSSMEVAIENLVQMEAKVKVAVLGDMYELGEDSDKEHRKLGELVKEANFDKVFFCGELIKPALEAYAEGLYFENKITLMEEIKKHSFENATILLKASRGIGLETILDSI